MNIAWQRVYKTFLCSTQLSMKFKLLPSCQVAVMKDKAVPVGLVPLAPSGSRIQSGEKCNWENFIPSFFSVLLYCHILT